jgi:diguanylate cyclase (GGDEF)-like protein
MEGAGVKSGTRVAVIVDRLHEYQMPVIRGVESVMHAHGGAVLVVLSHPLHAERDRTLRRMVAAGRVDGVVVTAMRHVDTHQHRAGKVVEDVQGVPVVTVGVRVRGVPVVLSDNRGGIQAALNHVLDDCGRTRPIMIAGILDNDDSQEREAAFLELAAERGLQLPDHPVTHAHFEREHAYRHIVERLRSGRDFDAVLVANDDMAMGVLDALNGLGVSVPDEVSVVGFDNTDMAYMTDPPLTSVDNEIEEQGRAAGRLILQLLAGEPVDAEVRPPATLVVRHSSRCGTLPELHAEHQSMVAARTAAGSTGRSDDRVSWSRDAVGDIVALAEDFTTSGDTTLRELLGGFLRTWMPAIAGGTLSEDDARAAGVELSEVIAARPEPLWWQSLYRAVEAVLVAVSPGPGLDPETRASLYLWRMEIITSLSRSREGRDRAVQDVSLNILEFNRGLSRCRSWPELVQELGAFLSRLNVHRCFMVLLEHHLDLSLPEQVAGEEAETDWNARLVFGYWDGKTQPLSEEIFDIIQFLPESHAGHLRHGTLTLQSLVTTDRFYGYLLHEQTPQDRHVGEALRLDLSRGLDSFARAKELAERAAELAKMVSMRTRQLEHEVASRQLAQERLREANLELRRALLVDGLTGLQNRSAFDEHLSQAWHHHLRRKEPLSVLMIDVDHFKRYNDIYGHLAGDACLRQIARCMQDVLVRKQDIAARYGGEEFSIILPQTDLPGARTVADRLLAVLRAENLPHEATEHGRVSLSIGIASTESPEATSMEMLVDLADQALYRAKRAGRDRAESSTEHG